jgi:4-hydroxybenzoyl-CoA reductase alpha subunit
MAASYSILGKDTPNYDGIAKVTGQAQYTFDLTLPRLLFGKVLRSPYAHARILSIDTSAAEKLPGVKAVITGKDTLGIKYGCWRRFSELCDEQGLCTDKVRYIGDAVAAVAAVDEDTAEEALDLIEVEYELLPAVFDPREAEKEGAPIIHDEFPNNVNVSRTMSWGDLERGFAASDVIREDRFSMQGVYAATLEVHNSVATWNGDRLTMYTSTGTPYYLQALLAQALGLSESDVRVITTYVGGAFGGKNELYADQFCSALLSKRTGRPVKIVFTREEDVTCTHRRIPMYYYLKIGAKKDGTLLAREVRVITNGGAYTCMNATGLYLTGWFASFPYTWPAYRYYGYKVYTNEQPSSSIRGFGAPQAVFASEQQIEMLAEDLGMDSIELRRKNGMYEGYEIPKQAYIGSCGLSQALDQMQAYVAKRRPELPEGHGIGLACFGFNSGGVFNWFNTPHAFSSALIKMNSDGQVDLHSLAADVGQGTTTTMAMLCAECLGIRLEDVRVHTGDTTLVSTDLGAWASRETMMMGNAIKMAADQIKQQLFQAAAAMMMPNIVYDFDIRDRRLFLRDRPERSLSLTDVVKVAMRMQNGQQLVGRGHYTPHGKGMVSPAFSFGIQAVEVKVDRETGHYRVVKVVTAHDSGTVLNPMAVRGQLEGAIHMSLGYAFCEDLPSEEGRILNPNLVDYKIIRYRDMPENESLECVTYEPEGPFGAKEAGEGLTCPTAGAIANAIYDAVGVRITDNPVTPEKVWRALKGAGGATV